MRIYCRENLIICISSSRKNQNLINEHKNRLFYHSSWRKPNTDTAENSFLRPQIFFNNKSQLELEGTQRLHTSASGLLGSVYRETSHAAHQVSLQDLQVYMNKMLDYMHSFPLIFCKNKWLHVLWSITTLGSAKSIVFW